MRKNFFLNLIIFIYENLINNLIIENKSKKNQSSFER